MAVFSPVTTLLLKIDSAQNYMQEKVHIKHPVSLELQLCECLE